MTTPNYGGAPSNARPHHVPENHWLEMRQEPEKARVVVRGKEKDRKPVDPPPIVQLKVQDPYNDTCSYLHNPYYFCSCTLWEAEEDLPHKIDSKPGAPPPEALQGQLVSSLHRLKDFDNTEQGFFVFSDVSVGVMGKYRLRFSVYEYRPLQGDCVFLKSQLSKVFEIVAPKDWDGVRESTALSRSFADQGVRIRLRKESRHSAKRQYTQQSVPQLAPQTPLRPHPQAAPSYESGTSQEGVAAQGEPAFKRHKPYPSGPGPYMSQSAPGWPTTMYAPVGGHQAVSNPLSYAQHQPGYYAPPYGAYPQQQQQQQQQPQQPQHSQTSQSQSSSYGSGYPSPSNPAAAAQQQQYSSTAARSSSYVQTTQGYAPNAAGAYSNAQYASVPSKYPSAPVSGYAASQHQSAGQGSMAAYGATQQQQSPYAGSSYAAGQQHGQHQQRAPYAIANQASPHAQYAMSQGTPVPYRGQAPSSSAPGGGQTQEELDEMMRRGQHRNMANPSTTPRLNPIAGMAGDSVVASTEIDDPTMQHTRRLQRSSGTHTPGVGEA